MKLSPEFMRGFNERATARAAEHAAAVTDSYDRQYETWEQHQTRERAEKEERALKAAEDWGTRRKELRERADRAQASLNDAKANLDQSISDDDLDAARKWAVDFLVWERGREAAAQELFAHEQGRPWMG